MTDTPRTEAGRDTFDRWADVAEDPERLLADILAIEAEAAAGPRGCSWPEKACALDRMVEAGAVPLERLDAIDAAGPRKHREGVWGPSGYGKGVCEVDGEPWPCKAAAGPRDEGLREWLDSPLRDYLDERDRAYLAALAGASE